jgi:hypothetical protein
VEVDPQPDRLTEAVLADFRVARGSQMTSIRLAGYSMLPRCDLALFVKPFALLLVTQAIMTTSVQPFGQRTRRRGERGEVQGLGPLRENVSLIDSKLLSLIRQSLYAAHTIRPWNAPRSCDFLSGTPLTAGSRLEIKFISVRANVCAMGGNT